MPVSWRTIYDVSGHTGNTYYIVCVEQRTGRVWNNQTRQMEENPDREDCAIILQEIGTSGRFVIELPDDLPKGSKYDIVVYKQDGSEPADTDNVQDTITVEYGSIFGF